MKAVGTKQLKNELSKYLQLVRQGETVLVLDRDEVVAEIRRPSSAVRHYSEAWTLALAEMEAAGTLQRATCPEGNLVELVARRPRVEGFADLLGEARADRF